MFLEFYPDKGIKNWIQAAMAVSDQSAHLECIFQMDACVTVVKHGELSVLQSPEEDDQVVGHPAEEEHGHHAQNQLHRSAPGVWSGPADLPQYLHVAKNRHHEGHQEENVLLGVAYDFPPEGVDLTALRVSVLVVDGDQGGVEQGGHGCPHADHPKHETDDEAAAGGVPAGVRERVDHGQVPVDGHGGQEEDAAVEAREEHKGHKFAEELGKQPPPDVVHHVEGKAGGEDEVGDSQVQDQDIGEVGHEVFVHSQDDKDQAVPHQAQQEHSWEKHRYRNGSKRGHVAFFADLVLIVGLIWGLVGGATHSSRSSEKNKTISW